ncbi:MAG: carbonic anhydrase family protein [Deltaproteobacteria bacterium]|nr:carbonic anhydrase family protein [Deltaproteobacteria bacterium]
MSNRVAGVLSSLVATLLLLAPASRLAAAEAAHHWSYAGETGPDHWGALEGEYGTCGLGHLQSPIDIHADAAKPSALPPIDFHYQAAPLSVIDNGHTIQVSYAPGSYIVTGGHRYDLVQFHFHKPSEEALDGKRFPMVAHLVHKDGDGKLAVVAVLLADGHENPVIDSIWKAIPSVQGKAVTVAGVEIDVSKLLPANHAYYTFAGSLTTPPCSEGVTWFVLQTPSTVSADEVAAFGAHYPMNARPLQPVNGREVRVSH